MNSWDLAVLVPTRGRPQAVPELAQAFVDTEAEAWLIFYVDDDDPTVSEYLSHASSAYAIHVGPRLRLAGTLNQAVAEVAPQFEGVVFMGDDHRPRTYQWDARFAECLSGGPGICYGNDLLMGAAMPTAVAMTSDIPLALGYFCPPGFTHLCLDLVWLDWGRGMDRITYLADVIVEHMHPANGKANLDAGYEEVNSQAMVQADTTAYFAYKADVLDADVAKLRNLL